MFRLARFNSHSITIKKSEFIALLYRVSSEEEAKEIIKQVRKEHPKARHVCSAMILGGDTPVQRSNDDGEPAGTAGLPILEVLRKREMENILAVVVRYFGGVLLGAGGLIRAYVESVSECLDLAELTETRNVLQSVVRFPIRFTDPILSYLKQTTILNKEFGSDVVLTLVSDDDEWLAKCRNLCGGQFSLLSQEVKQLEVPVKNDS
jgi:uncharacterized YigZ family protein